MITEYYTGQLLRVLIKENKKNRFVDAAFVKYNDEEDKSTHPYIVELNVGWADLTVPIRDCEIYQNPDVEDMVSL